MTHLTMDQLLALREPGSEPGAAAAREHVEGCAACAAELDRLHQRVARLRALPTLGPARDLWPAVKSRRRSERRRLVLRRAGLATVALAASLAGIAVVRSDAVRPGAPPAAEQLADGELAAVKQSSRALENVLEAYNPQARVVDGHTARIAGVLEDRIAEVDQQLQAAELERNAAMHRRELLQLWRERVGLLDALVDVHVTRASNVGL
jgi:hypothetical protein